MLPTVKQQHIILKKLKSLKVKSTLKKDSY